jgi:hypothetical protein
VKKLPFSSIGTLLTKIRRIWRGGSWRSTLTNAIPTNTLFDQIHFTQEEEEEEMNIGDNEVEVMVQEE